MLAILRADLRLLHGWVGRYLLDCPIAVLAPVLFVVPAYWLLAAGGA